MHELTKFTDAIDALGQSVVLDRINAMMPTIARAAQTAGRRDTQFVTKHMNSFMLGRTPFAIMRQAMAKIQRSSEGLKEAEFRHKKNLILIDKWQAQLQATDDEIERRLLALKIEKTRHGIEQSALYISGAVKNIANYMEIYEQVRQAANIPGDWDELDYEKAEADHHLQQAFLQAFRDVWATGRIGVANSEYLENVGIGPVTGLREVARAAMQFKKMEAAGQPVLMKDIDAWLKTMAEKYGSVPEAHLAYHGLKAIDDWYVFKDRNR